MKTFISAEDIEALASQGVRELTVDEDTVLTAVARETARQLGVKLVAPGQARPIFSERTSPAKPRGCQHGPIPLSGPGAGRQAGPHLPAPSGTSSAASPIVDDLIGAVKQLAKK